MRPPPQHGNVRGPRAEIARRPVSRVLSAASPVARGAAGRPFLWDAPRGAPHATNPGDGAGMPLVPATPARRGTGRPYSVLLPVGFTLPLPLPGARCALAAPFHPCPLRPARGAGGTGGLFSVALSLGSPPPAVGRHRIPVEPGLSSTARRRSSAGSSGRPAVWPGGDAPAIQAGQASAAGGGKTSGIRNHPNARRWPNAPPSRSKARDSAQDSALASAPGLPCLDAPLSAPADRATGRERRVR